MKLRAYRQRRSVELAELNITAFLNLMVVLVPFLLITAVFAQITVLELQLPDATSSQDAPNDGLGLEIRVLSDATLEIHTRKKGLIKQLPNVPGHFEKLGRILLAIKNKVPHEESIILRVSDTTPYNTLIQAMDTLRVTPQRINGQMVKVALFPNISLGHLPSQGELK